MSRIKHICHPEGECFCVYIPECNPDLDTTEYVPAARAEAAEARVAELEGALERVKRAVERIEQAAATDNDPAAPTPHPLLGSGRQPAQRWSAEQIRAALSPPEDKRCPRCGGGIDVRACTEGERCPVLHPPKDKPPEDKPEWKQRIRDAFSPEDKP